MAIRQMHQFHAAIVMFHERRAMIDPVASIEILQAVPNRRRWRMNMSADYAVAFCITGSYCEPVLKSAHKSDGLLHSLLDTRAKLLRLQTQHSAYAIHLAVDPDQRVVSERTDVRQPLSAQFQIVEAIAMQHKKLSSIGRLMHEGIGDFQKAVVMGKIP